MKMQETVISHPRTLDQVILEGQNNYSAYTTIEPCKTGNFRVKLEFINLDSENLKSILKLFNLSKALRFESGVIANGNFNITHIIIKKFFAGRDFAITWECLSEQPEYEPLF